jgi:hypothetical protein
VAEKEYSVGRGRPPVQNRFRPGQSGNPSGRPKLAPTFRSELTAELGETVLRANGQRISKQRAVIGMLVSAALGGDLRAISVLVSLLGRPSEQEADADLTEHDVQILKNLEQRERGNVVSDDEGKP